MARKSSVERANEIIGGFATAQKNVVIQFGGGVGLDRVDLDPGRHNVDRGSAEGVCPAQRSAIQVCRSGCLNSQRGGHGAFEDVCDAA